MAGGPGAQVILGYIKGSLRTAQITGNLVKNKQTINGVFLRKALVLGLKGWLSSLCKKDTLDLAVSDGRLYRLVESLSQCSRRQLVPRNVLEA